MRLKVVGLLIISIGVILFAEPLRLGSPGSFMKQILDQNVRADALFTLPTCCGGDVELLVRDFSYDGTILEVTGSVASYPYSAFYVHATEQKVSGYIHFKENEQIRDSDLVYRYSMDELKNVVVEPVGVSDVFVINRTIPPESFQNLPDPAFYQDEFPKITHLGPYPGTDIKKLQSRPESKKVVYLDISSVSKPAEDVWIMWQYVSSGLSMFDVNVTTDKAIYSATPGSNRGINTLYNSEGQSYCPRVNTFGSNDPCHVYWMKNARGAGLTAIHETGHMTAVADAGHSSQGTYFFGFPEFKWVPIMGHYWKADPWEPDALYQWVKGEYDGANSAAKQDFFQYAQRNLSLLPDDMAAAKPLKLNGTKVSMVDNYGRVGPGGDKDEFSFEVAKDNSAVDLTVRPIERMVMLDVNAAILDEGGKVVVEDNPKASRSATLKKSLPKGKYTLRIQGGAEGTPSNGFSTYGSVGYFGISGSVDGGTNLLTKQTKVGVLDNNSLSISTSQLRVSLPEGMNVRSVNIYSAIGKQIVSSTGEKTVIDISHVAPGIYTAKVDVDGVMVSKRFIKR